MNTYVAMMQFYRRLFQDVSRIRESGTKDFKCMLYRTTTSRSRSRSTARSTIKRRSTPSITTLKATTADQKWNLPVLVHHPPAESKLAQVPGVLALQPILLICGFAGAGSTDWGSIPKMLAAKTKRPVVTYDARGLGNSIRTQKSICTSTGTGTGGDTDTSVINSDHNDLDLTMNLMALDALSVVKHYYENEHNNAVAAKHEKGVQRNFCVGGVSMGGMVAQALAHTLHHDDQNDYQVSSLGLISSSPIQDSSSGLLGEYPTWDDVELSEDHFLLAFDNFHNESETEKYHSTKRFFDALGQDFISKPGRKALRDKLIASFISSREEFVNGIGFDGIMAQRSVLLNESHGVWNNQNKPLHLGDLGIPSIVIHGKKDSIIPFNHGKRLHYIMDNKSTGLTQEKSIAKFGVIQHCDHLCWITNGHELVQMVGAFFQKRTD